MNRAINKTVSWVKNRMHFFWGVNTSIRIVYNSNDQYRDFPKIRTIIVFESQLYPILAKHTWRVLYPGNKNPLIYFFLLYAEMHGSTVTVSIFFYLARSLHLPDININRINSFNFITQRAIIRSRANWYQKGEKNNFFLEFTKFQWEEM